MNLIVIEANTAAIKGIRSENTAASFKWIARIGAQKSPKTQFKLQQILLCTGAIKLLNG